MKNAQEMYTITQEATKRRAKQIATKRIVTALAGLIETEANKGMTYVKVPISDLPFDNNFFASLGNLEAVALELRKFDYKAHVILDNHTGSIFLHVDWTPDELEEVFKELGAVIRASSQF